MVGTSGTEVLVEKLDEGRGRDFPQKDFPFWLGRRGSRSWAVLWGTDTLFLVPPGAPGPVERREESRCEGRRFGEGVTIGRHCSHRSSYRQLTYSSVFSSRIHGPVRPETLGPYMFRLLQQRGVRRYDNYLVVCVVSYSSNTRVPHPRSPLFLRLFPLPRLPEN